MPSKPVYGYDALVAATGDCQAQEAGFEGVWMLLEIPNSRLR